MVNRDKEKRFMQYVSKGRIQVNSKTGVIYTVFTIRRCATSQNNNGYIRVTSGTEAILAHRLIWMCAYGEIPDGYDINHKNGNKSDNRIDNLELMTRSENIVHARNVLGRIIGIYGRTFSGEKNGNAKLSWDKVRKIREMYATGNYSQYNLANKFGVCQAVIGKVIRNESWIE